MVPTGAHVVQKLVAQLAPLLERRECSDGKEMDCLVLLLAHLYNYRVRGPASVATSFFPVCLQVIHCLLIYDLIRRLVETFSERDVGLLLLLLKSKY